MIFSLNLICIFVNFYELGTELMKFGFFMHDFQSVMETYFVTLDPRNVKRYMDILILP